MNERERGFWVLLISPKALGDYMKFRRISIRELAVRAGCSRSTIGHLRSGYRKGCSPDIARAIERCLDAPPNVLFRAEVSTVLMDSAHQRPTRRSA